MKRNYCITIILGWLLMAAHVFGSDGFEVDAKWHEDAEGTTVQIDFAIEPGYYIYTASYAIEGMEDTRIEAVQVPTPETKTDPFTKEPVDVYAHSFTARYKLLSAGADKTGIAVHYQGCNQDTCFMPETREFLLESNSSTDKKVPLPSLGREDKSHENESWRTVADSFEVVAIDTGYMNSDRMLAFINNARQGRENGRKFDLEKHSFWVAIGLILLGGLALNLTPCVLPMLPINLAIIGAGSQAGTRARGFMLGGIYGMGIALTYGVLGVVVVLTGSTFGTLNASPWFNVGIAAVFVVLALGMFDVIHIDFTRFQRNGPQKRSGVWLAFSMGIVAALLAGACVAPVVISVLLWSSSLYGKGVVAGLVLPFVLGAGMALPWPFAGAGLSFLPKPGRWMVWIRNGFGVLILVMAFWYAMQAWHGFGITTVKAGNAADHSGEGREENEMLAAGLNTALREKTMVFIDFTASWCKNCKAMKAATFKDDEVVEALQTFEFIEYAAENPGAPVTKDVIDYFDVHGLPTYVILRPVAAGDI